MSDCFWKNLIGVSVWCNSPIEPAFSAAFSLPYMGGDNYNSICVNDDTIIAVTEDGQIVSNDKLLTGEWVYRSSTQYTGRTAVWDGVKFVTATSGNGNLKTKSSADGISWADSADLPSVSGNFWYDIGYAQGKIVVMGAKTAAISTDHGDSWTGYALQVIDNWNYITASPSLFVAVGWNTQALTSSDGQTWTLRTGLTARSWIDITWNGNVFVAVTDDTTIVAVSTDGIAWTEYNLPSVGNGYYAVSALDSGTICALGDEVMAYSLDNGVTWAVGATPAIYVNYNGLHSDGVNFYAISYGSNANVMITSN